MTTDPAPGLLTADARRSLALLAGDDLPPDAAAAARDLAASCPHCRGHLERVRGGLEVLTESAAVPGDAGESLWPGVRDRLTSPAPAVTLAPEPREYAAGWNRWIPAFAVTAASLCVGLVLYAPQAGEIFGGSAGPSGTLRPASVGAPPADRERPAVPARVAPRYPR